MRHALSASEAVSICHRQPEGLDVTAVMPFEALRAGRLVRNFASTALVVVALLVACPATADPIRWAPNVADGYDRGVAERKAIVVFFYDSTGNRYSADTWSTRLSLNPRIQAIQDSAVWCYGDVSSDIVAKNIAKALEIDGFPAISVLEPESESLSETARVVHLGAMTDMPSDQEVEDYLINRIAQVLAKWSAKQ